MKPHSISASPGKLEALFLQALNPPDLDARLLEYTRTEALHEVRRLIDALYEDQNRESALDVLQTTAEAR